MALRTRALLSARRLLLQPSLLPCTRLLSLRRISLTPSYYTHIIIPLHCCIVISTLIRRFIARDGSIFSSLRSACDSKRHGQVKARATLKSTISLTPKLLKHIAYSAADDTSFLCC